MIHSYVSFFFLCPDLTETFAKTLKIIREMYADQSPRFWTFIANFLVHFHGVLMAWSHAVHLKKFSWDLCHEIVHQLGFHGEWNIFKISWPISWSIFMVCFMAWSHAVQLKKFSWDFYAMKLCTTQFFMGMQNVQDFGAHFMAFFHEVFHCFSWKLHSFIAFSLIFQKPWNFTTRIFMGAFIGHQSLSWSIHGLFMGLTCSSAPRCSTAYSFEYLFWVKIGTLPYTSSKNTPLSSWQNVVMRPWMKHDILKCDGHVGAEFLDFAALKYQCDSTSLTIVSVSATLSNTKKLYFSVPFLIPK